MHRMSTVATKTSKSEMTRAAIIGAALDIALAEGLEAITLQAVADRVGLSKSGVFSRVGSREALQSAVIEGIRSPLPSPTSSCRRCRRTEGAAAAERHCASLDRAGAVVEANTGCLYTAGAFELDDREGPLREQLLRGMLGWRAALRRGCCRPSSRVICAPTATSSRRSPRFIR